MTLTVTPILAKITKARVIIALTTVTTIVIITVTPNPITLTIGITARIPQIVVETILTSIKLIAN